MSFLSSLFTKWREAFVLEIIGEKKNHGSKTKGKNKIIPKEIISILKLYEFTS